MATSKKKRYIEFQLLTNNCWYIAEVLPKNGYSLCFSRTSASNHYNPWPKNWKWGRQNVFSNAPTLHRVNEDYTILNHTFFTEDDLFAKVL